MSPDPETQPEAEWYEPWQPQIGQRVRIRASAECPVRNPVAARLDDECGQVAEIDRSDPNGHFYRVAIDHPELFEDPWMHLFGTWCAAIELEPVGELTEPEILA